MTWGGSLISLNSSGRSVDPYLGKPRDWVMGLQAVLPTGEIVETGTHGLRRPCGFDLTQFLIGGQCLFGVVTNVRLRLFPTPRQIIGALVHFPSLKALGEGVGSVYQSRAPYPRLMEVLDKTFLETMSFDGDKPAGMLMVGTDGDAPGEAEWKLDELIKVLRQEGATEAEKVSQERWQEMLEFREAGLSKLNPRGLILLTGEVLNCPLDKLPQALEDAHQLQQRLVAAHPGLLGYINGHIGAGSFHPAFAAPAAWGYDRLRVVVTEIRDEFLKFKLTQSATIGEQGIFPEHRGWYLGYNGQLHLNALLAVKKALDPNEVLNPLRLSDMRDGQH